MKNEKKNIKKFVHGMQARARQGSPVMLTHKEHCFACVDEQIHKLYGRKAKCEKVYSEVNRLEKYLLERLIM